ncbi:MAG: ATP-binding cassette domain-containing protein [Bacteroidetes bacterium]|uniref:Probable ATP-binding protein YbiT n=1 Tax=Candidatus Gallipaludibacter merdavium TaxID=2840839 RepID=A0A9D9HUW2_9BACT|nr:ATP-binding cassette domain-containing protein [Candidatus Gallipaludibacter merdavium]
MISVEQLTVEFSSKPLFSGISFLINPKDKIALVGKNGAGKSTLLKLLAGLQQPTSGIISIPSGLTIGYLPQHMIHDEGTTVMQEAQKAFKKVNDLQEHINQLANELAERTDYESEGYQRLIEQMAHENEMLQVLGGGNFAGELEKTLIGLGFLRSDFDRQCSEFSGGWRMRIELAKILLQRPELFLLDEPTNHLDIESIQWLENFLKNYSGAIVLVSHDRAFIDNVTNRTIEISLGKIYDYNVNYSKFVELRKERREQQIRAYENQQKMIADTEEFIERFRYKATKAVQVQSRIKQLEKVERIEIDLEDTSRLHLKFPPAPRSGDFPIIIENLRKAYGDHLVFDHVEFTIKRGEKVAFVGKNGEGKSTLVKCIMGELTDYTGTLKIGHNVKIGYFAQNQASLLDENKTVFETIDYVAVGDIRTKIRDILGAFMFGGEASDKKVKVLSGGERSRLAMIRLLLEPVNLLILDEPTNHLDMQSKDVLKEAIRAFDGTVILVSHDREFLDGLVSKVYEFGNQRVKEHLGGIYDFLREKNITQLNELELTRQEKKKEEKTDSQNKLSYEARKELARQLRKQERLVEEAEQTVTRLEKELAEIEQKLSQPETPSTDLLDTYQNKKHLLEQKMYEWEILAEQLEQMKSQQ